MTLLEIENLESSKIRMNHWKKELFIYEDSNGDWRWNTGELFQFTAIDLKSCSWELYAESQMFIYEFWVENGYNGASILECNKILTSLTWKEILLIDKYTNAILISKKELVQK